MNSKYPGATVTVARGNPQSLALNDSPSNHLGPVVQMLDSAIHRINHYPLDSVIGFPNTYPLDSDLSGG